MDNPDFLIVGGGSAGATLAARLSEDPATRVLLVEAGPDTPPQATPADIVDTFPSSALNPNYFWPKLEAARFADGALHPFPQARVMGGGSSVMGLVALRGMPSDYDAWAAAGAEGWGWSDVVRYFRKAENDLDRDQSQSAARPYTIRRIPANEWPGFVTAMERAAVTRGLPIVPDINENPGDGFFPMPVSQSGDIRSTSPSCYLTQSVRKRSNLAIITEARVTALHFDGTRACGAVVERGGETIRIDAREVVLSAGAIHSPAILLRAGVGPAEELKRLGITPVADRRGVGRNLQNHPYLHFAVTLPPRSRLASQLRRFAIAGIRQSSGLEGGTEADMLIFIFGRVSPRSYGPDLAMLGAALYAPYSRGSVTLATPDAATPPNIDFRMLEDPRDAPRMAKAGRLVETLLLDPAVANSYSDAFLLPPTMALNQFNRQGLVGGLLAAAAKVALNLPAPLSRALIGPAIRPGRWFANRHGRSPLTDAEILGAAVPMAHPSGTCAIGRKDDPMAVVDSTCRVYGVQNLRVVDASVMPRIPAANTNLPTIMVAERAADLIKSSTTA
ncbi:MAG: GMC family oxidoreductase N-terminal domain-containing protein [Bradyrhizobiaceae bacterium]|nr:GMC family oxidoreductase N-terminal domain-containing protein [Bradyrhizobiaceae bacterium]